MFFCRLSVFLPGNGRSKRQWPDWAHPNWFEGVGRSHLNNFRELVDPLVAADYEGAHFAQTMPESDKTEGCVFGKILKLIFYECGANREELGWPCGFHAD